ncbi:tRNA (adenosine(37)-N6)-threonylcarbamoyltransferase complex dimerization subunit type 1 TsaB [Nitrosomonas sp. Is24]|uniref:tRNA (adenosine(37)-N6)-threonylcarbamoyltransferase complex dimerization subunit type 1 TsaB n=1 Tax=Nitrosomonas sp. Is24 TaxID=3080533 RepID=UPI00294B5A82|nr:tRNA (adenosine(37)-N6)-threonylcarbamoyltransferase complex dimerization subunit type 1 TsaB [Nitrosomonas sp. Is24]MDV6340588.1 tRNA (adenosine(37)-N6)-threonylcarbamoyltransferase complex dimerization subunit type 1 TsaB [Nitrosomonas sp. Is24]
MKILALETSTEFCSVALSLDGTVSGQEILAGRTHSEMILPMVQKFLAEAELALQQLDGIAFGAGPGSFTGLRIACGVAQGLAYATGLPVAAISTLEAVAQQTDAEKVIVALDARMGELYYAAYQKSAHIGWIIINPPALCLPQQAPAVSGNGWHGCGSGFDVYPDLSQLYREHIEQIHHGLHPRALEVAQLALPKFRDGACIDPAHAMPVYIRNKVALKENER